MKNKKEFSVHHSEYVKKLKRETVAVWTLRFALLFCIIGLWELFAQIQLIDPFISSSPSKIILTIENLITENNLFYHIGVTLFETIAGFLIAVLGGFIIALLLWWSERLRRVLEPYIVVLNSLPKIALGPIIIVWFGSGSKSIIFMAVLISIIVATITMLNGFLATDKNKILLLKSMGANKFQIMTKLIFPATLPNFISTLKINLGMAWVGVIMGEYLSSKAGLGYLLVYGGQVFNLDLVMCSITILCILSGIMYGIISICERIVTKKR